MPNKLQVKTQSVGYSDFYWNRFSPRVATISSIRNANHWEGGFITYIAYPRKVEAIAAMKYLLLHQQVTDVDMRKAKRMKAKGIRWELKIRGLAFNQVLKFATMDITSSLVMSPAVETTSTRRKSAPRESEG
ncbi:MAG: hypothetical protein EAZ98_02690 [Oscillatoriales cyanobacterium]|uniref:Uncharacterized protein n=2 Tax=Microcoleus TaxID=44471 RepID=A0ABU8YNT9_9CYAN|nr:MAG: hypothetical protein EA000_01395 [Oscillatoriales cyanobacterium]TAE01842.1 MAG: hypothetical protein EAZ98_02690 [Oscillatoriales cyanobacterium]TAE03574.1 MAG: hypothetical protein EAZ96_12500 [Oscillatoriales cyanobacterium]